MADSIVLYGPGGASPLQLGSWIKADPGPDFGARGLVQAIEAESFADGGRFIYDRAGIRRMAFPLLLGAAGGASLAQIESMIRLNARVGGYIDVQVEGTPSAEAVRFDLIHGRYEPAYQIQYNRAGRRAGDLMLDTQPFGYWPTVILLASVASMPFPSGIAFTAGSVIGDAPALAEVFVSPHAALPSQQAAGAWRTDAIGWSLNGHGPSFNPFIAGGSFSVTNFTAGGSVLDPAAPATSMLQAIYGQTAMASWIPAFFWTTPTGLEPAYRGRFRAFTFLKVTPSGVPPYQISVDVVAGEKFAGGILPALASAAPVATVPPGLASQNPGLGSAPGVDLYGAVPSHGYVIVDCGEIALPPAASGFSTRTALRVWAKQGVANTTLGSQTMWLGGVYLLPVDSAQAIVTRGILAPSVNDQNSVYGGVTPSVGYVHKIGYGPMFTVKGGVHYDSLLQFTRGAVQPVLGASVNRLDLIAFDRAIGPNAATYDPMVHVQQHQFSTVSVSYTPRFLFLKGL